MARKRTGYDAACYYGDKLMGRCTTADSDDYVTLMNACGGSAARVLKEYAYFSVELKAILEKVAAIQEKENRSAGIFTPPKTSPWGDVQTCDTLCPGVYLVSTASHGGTMFSKDMAAVLSPTAQKCGFQQGGFLCFEEDCQEDVAMRELLDKKLWEVPERIKDKAAYEENINRSIRENNPDYWRVRQAGLEKKEARQPTAHSAER